MSDAVELWTVYDHPRDYPHYFVARRFLIAGNQLLTTSEIVACIQLAPLREALARRGLVPIARYSDDDPVIVESWF